MSSKSATIANMKAPLLQGMAVSGGGGANGMQNTRHGSIHHEHHGWEDSPAYHVLIENNLLETKYRVRDARSLLTRPANSTAEAVACCNLCSCFLLGCPKALVSTFEVPKGHIRLIEDGRGAFEFCGPGIHFIKDPWYRVVGDNISINDEVIEHGDRTICTVKQGFIGFALDQGEPVLLPPGLHQWQSLTLRFQRQVDLTSAHIELGPYTLLTVDEGYAAVTQNNGKQNVLPGGQTHLLTHRNWKFEKFISKKIQTDDLERIEATSADNVLIGVRATVTWRITDVDTAARCSIKTMRMGKADYRAGDAVHGGGITKLRNDVLKQAEASLSSFVGTVNYSSTFSVSAAVQGGSIVRNTASGLDAGLAAPTATVIDSSGGGGGGGAPQAPAIAATEAVALFDTSRLRGAVAHANELTMTYGVQIISINIISARPADDALMNSLAKGAVAAAEARQAETAAYGLAKAAGIKAEGKANADVIEARGAAEAEKVRAEGARAAAELLATSDVAVQLAMVGKTGQAIKGANASMFFGADSANLGALMANPKVVQAGRKR